MQENLNMKVSQFIDDELDVPQAVSLMKEVRNNVCLVKKLNRYQTIRNALKSENVVAVDMDFVKRISQQIEQEPVHFIPAKKNSVISWKTTSLAVAASLVLLAVLLPKTFDQSQSPTHIEQNSLIAQQKISSQAEQDRKTQLVKARTYINNQRLNEYLQAHSNSIYTIGASNYQPYARVAGYSQE